MKNLDPVTRTAWNLCNMSRPFPAKMFGTCALSGQKFMSGEQIRIAELDGRKVTVTQRWMASLQCTITESGEVQSRFEVGMGRFEAVLRGETIQRIVVLNAQGKGSTYERQADGWKPGIGRPRSVAQMVSLCRAAVAFMAYGERA